jgi:hypothetical protein
MGASLSVGSVVAAVQDQLSCDLGGEVTILNVKNGAYYGLDPIASRVWSLLQQPHSVGEVRDLLVGEYDVEPERCENDVLALIDRLLAEGLVELKSRETP